MAAKMAAEILDLMYLSSAFRYNNEWSVDSYEIKNVEIKYVENNNNSCIFSKMAAKMAAENLNLMYLSSAFRYKNEWSVDSYEIKNLEIKYVGNNNNSCIFFKMAAKMAAENFEMMYLSSSGIHKNKWMWPVMLCQGNSVYVEIHNKNCIIIKMAANMAAEYLNLVYLCSAIRCKEKWSVRGHVNQVKYAEFRYLEIITNSRMFFKMAKKIH